MDARVHRQDITVVLGVHHYRVTRPWGRLPQSLEFRFVSQVAVDSRGYVYVCQRMGPPVVVLDPDGEYVTSWGADRLLDPHGISVDAQDRVFVVDRDAHEVVVFDSGGEELMSIGNRHRPRFDAPFNHPTAATVGPGGDIYVTDGYANAAVHRFDATGELVASWGGRGDRPGEFRTPHGIWHDGAGRVLVVDRENDRVQVFDEGGKVLSTWREGLYHPMAICGHTDGTVLVTDQVPSVSLFSRDGVLLGRARPALYEPHGIGRAPNGDVFLAEASPTDWLGKLTPVEVDDA